MLYVDKWVLEYDLLRLCFFKNRASLSLLLHLLRQCYFIATVYIASPRAAQTRSYHSLHLITRTSDARIAIPQCSKRKATSFLTAVLERYVYQSFRQHLESYNYHVARIVVSGPPGDQQDHSAIASHNDDRLETPLCTTAPNLNARPIVSVSNPRATIPDPADM